MKAPIFAELPQFTIEKSGLNYDKYIRIKYKALSMAVDREQNSAVFCS